jgi:hypothetical protein
MDLRWLVSAREFRRLAFWRRFATLGVRFAAPIGWRMILRERGAFRLGLRALRKRALLDMRAIASGR